MNFLKYITCHGLHTIFCTRSFTRKHITLSKNTHTCAHIHSVMHIWALKHTNIHRPSINIFIRLNTIAQK